MTIYQPLTKRVENVPHRGDEISPTECGCIGFTLHGLHYDKLKINLFYIWSLQIINFEYFNEEILDNLFFKMANCQM